MEAKVQKLPGVLKQGLEGMASLKTEQKASQTEGGRVGAGWGGKQHHETKTKVNEISSDSNRNKHKKWGLTRLLEQIKKQN